MVRNARGGGGGGGGDLADAQRRRGEDQTVAKKANAYVHLVLHVEPSLKKRGFSTLFAATFSTTKKGKKKDTKPI